MKTKKKIVLTGGHAGATGYAVIEEIKKRDGENWDIYWIGTEKAVEGKISPTLESRVLPKIGVKFYPIISGRLQRKFTIWTIPSLLKVPLGFVHAFLVLKKINPDIVVSFGGFTAFPVVVIAWLLRKPIVIHEQTMAAGRANRLSSFFAKKIALAREDSKKFFPPQKCVVVGNPISREVGFIKAKNVLSNPPVLFVTGGSRGSEFINDTLGKILRKLLSRYIVIHQTGVIDFQKFDNIRSGLPVNLKEKYHVYDLIESWKWPKFLESSDLLLSRAGANIVSEIISTKRPAILIPISWTYLNEQYKNAMFAKNYGVAEVVNQVKATPELINQKIDETIKNWDKIVERVRKKESPDKNAASNLVKIIEDTLL